MKIVETRRLVLPRVALRERRLLMRALYYWAREQLCEPFEFVAELSDTPLGAGLLGFILGNVLTGLGCALIYG